jgi:serine/threonine-protein kinase
MLVRVTAPDLGRLELEAAIAGRYQIEGELGRGGMGLVYLAHDLALERPVAIKVLSPRVSQVPDFRKRFLRESRTVAGLSHPHIVPVHSVEEHGTLLFFVMGYIEGESLAGRIRRVSQLPSGEVIRILREIGWALGYAHGRGIVHRDVKPENILLEHATGRAMLADFGIARLLESSPVTAEVVLGTPYYMSPEQAAGAAIDGRSDLYSLGVVGFQAAVGRVPFDAASPHAVLALHLTQAPPPVSGVRPDLPHRLAATIDRCLRKDPASRWPTADAFIAALPSPTTALIEVAPQVRNFERAAMLAGSQVIMLLIVLPPLMALRPAAADALLAVLVFGSLAAILQLRRRAALLLSQGYGYGDFRGALQAELRQRDEESAALSGAAEPGAGQSPIAWIAAAAGIAIAAHALISGPTAAGARRVELAIGVGMFAVALIARFVGSPTRRFGVSRASAWFWIGGAGEALFQWLARLGQSAKAQDPDARWSTPQSQSGLTPEQRAAHAAIREVIADLEPRRAEAERQERAIGEALASTEWRTGPIDRDDEPAQRLAERRRSLVEEMRAARQRCQGQRERLEMAAENLRIQLTRLDAGMVEPEEALKDVRAARELLA